MTINGMHTHINITLLVPDIKLIYLLREFILLNGFSARYRKGEAPFEVLHPVHGADAQPLQHKHTQGHTGKRVGMDTKYNTMHVRASICVAKN